MSTLNSRRLVRFAALCLMIGAFGCGAADSKSSGAIGADAADDVGADAASVDVAEQKDVVPTEDIPNDIAVQADTSVQADIAVQADVPVPTCVPGTENCSCAGGSVCAAGKDGQPLKCSTGTCVRQDCTAGAHGCGCNAGGCALSNDKCIDWLCQDPNCTPGTKDCKCLTGSCSGSALICLGGEMCVDSAGYEGGKCLSSGGCKTGNLCDPAQNVCVYCELGSAGCQAKVNGSCNAGLGALNGICRLASTLPPTSPKCYTPCLPVKGSAVSCVDNLQAGCHDNKTCTNGECLAPGATNTICTHDSDCTDWQVCMWGGCYSNCESNAQCGPNSDCVRHVCRESCAKDADCPQGMVCNAGGASGYCASLVPTSAVTAPSVVNQPSFHVTKTQLLLTNVNPKLSLQIEYGEAQTPGVFRIRKVSHRVTKTPADQVVKGPGLDPKTHAIVPCSPSLGNCAMPWVTLQADGVITKGESMTVIAQPNCVRECLVAGCTNRCPEIFVSNDPTFGAARWQGEFEVTMEGGGIGAQSVSATYSERPDGQWTGSVYYFGSFNDDNGTLSDPDSSTWYNSKNAFAQFWYSFRSGGLGALSSVEMRDAMTSLTEESWNKESIRAKCKTPDDPNNCTSGKQCYPRSADDCYGVWVGTQSDAQVPSGVTQLPFAMNLQVDPNDTTLFSGRVVSATALQYPGNPAVKLRFATDPAAPTGSGTAATFLKHGAGVELDANALSVSLGGRYLMGNEPGCTKFGYIGNEVPWLIPGFTDGTSVSAETKALVRTTCLDGIEPFTDGVANLEAARANPVPNGMPINRRIEFLDGVLVDQTKIYLIFRERFEDFVPRKDPKTTAAYGVILLKRVPADLKPADFAGTPKQTLVREDSKLKGIVCDNDTLAAVGDPIGVDQRVTNLINGTAGKSGVKINWNAAGYDNNTAPAQIHYFCEDNGLFDGGAGDNDSKSTQTLRVACPVASKVVFFYTGNNLSQSQIASEPCQQDYTTDAAGIMLTPGTCGKRLKQWQDAGATVIGSEPYVSCTNASLPFCDEPARKDLRTGKSFVYYQNTSEVTAPSLRSLIGDAFRYKTKFMTATGGQVGFTPAICSPVGTAANPYCYDPAQVQAARKRVDCLIATATGPDYAKLNADSQQKLVTFLQGNFSQFQVEKDFPQAWVNGFERLYAELLVMLGDDALTAAYASRFDLAGVNVATFLGKQFEGKDGINLTGVAGAEFYKLYQASQYYQLALDRLYALGPNLAASFDKSVPDGNGGQLTVGSFHKPEMVTLYMERLTRAATQKALATSEIANRYQLLKQTKLAQRVLERGYASAYLEGALLGQLMKDVTANADSSYEAGLLKVLQDTQLRFSSSMDKMRDVYAQLSVGADTFGYPEDYVPFPALEDSGLTANAFSALADIAKTKMAAAATREQVALDSNLTGRVDAVQFATELVNISNTYENQLADLCGTFTGDDGIVYPAIKKYADKSAKTALAGDPCGRVENGNMYESMLTVQDSDAGYRQSKLRYDNLDAQVIAERDRVAVTCGIDKDVADKALIVDKAGATLTQDRANDQADLDFAKTCVDSASQAIQTAAGACSASPIPALACAVSSAAAVYSAEAQILVGANQKALTKDYVGKEKTQADSQNDQTYLEATTPCKKEIEQLNLVTITNLRRQQKEIVMDIFRAAVQAQKGVSDLKSLRAQATRLQSQQDQAEALQINFAAAKNDPNVRLYQNDSVIEADIFYRDALKAAYAATRAYEYFTSQSYGKKQNLYLARMVQTGQDNLQDYMMGLDNAFTAYQQEYGSPDLRVVELSLLNDILQIPKEEAETNSDGTPHVDADGVPYMKALTTTERVGKMRAAMKDPSHYDSNGYLSLSFATRVSDLSPLTRNHKIHHITIDIQGEEVGDDVARVYLRMLGTGSIQRLDDLTSYFALPARTAVVNTTLGGSSVQKFTAGDIYSAYHLRDRPLVNSLWQLVFNQRDEKVNQDVKLESISNIYVRIYYTDVTKF